MFLWGSVFKLHQEIFDLVRLPLEVGLPSLAASVRGRFCGILAVPPKFEVPFGGFPYEGLQYVGVPISGNCHLYYIYGDRDLPSNKDLGHRRGVYFLCAIIYKAQIYWK